MVYIVLEYLLLENFIINYLILSLNKILLRIEVKGIRLITGGGLASLFSLIFFYPKLHFLTTSWGKLIISIIIIRISYGFINYKIFIKALMGFYIISFIIAGASMGLYLSKIDLFSMINKNFTLLGGFPIKYLIMGIGLSYIIIKSVFKYHNYKSTKDNYIVDTTIFYKNQSISFKALLDTGNSLKDPITNKKVIVVEYNVLRGILPEKVGALVEANNSEDYEFVERTLTQIEMEIRLMMIPFRSVGKSGIIFAFKPDNIVLEYEKQRYEKKDLLVGLYSGCLTKEMGYSGLMHFELLSEGERDDEYFNLQNKTGSI